MTKHSTLTALAAACAVFTFTTPAAAEKPSASRAATVDKNQGNADDRRAERQELLCGLSAAAEIKPRLARIASYLQSLDGQSRPYHGRTKGHRALLEAALTETEALELALISLEAGLEKVGHRVGGVQLDKSGGMKESVEALRRAIDDALTDLESNETLGNMEIQDLMSRYNQAEQLAGSTFKKKDDADLAIINKI